MSLINEALHKAQNQRNQAPGLGDGPGKRNQPTSYSDRPSRIGLMIGLGFCIIILLGLVAGLTVVLLSGDNTQTTQHPSPATDETVRSDETANAADTLSPEPTEAAVSEPDPLAVEVPQQPPEVAEEPVVETEPSQEIIDWIDQSTVSGVRITSSSSKVILNNKAFIPNDKVNMSLDLKILEIEAERIVFIDSNGVEYTKLF